MREIFIAIVLCFLVLGCEEEKRGGYLLNGKRVPTPLGWVSDNDDIFTIEEEQELSTLLEKYADEAEYEIAIVSIGSSMEGEPDDDMFTITLELASSWGIGDAEKGNGMLIGISRARRKIVIQNGVGTEKVLSDLQTKKFIDSFFIPQYEKGEIFKGTLLGTKAIMDFLRDKKIPHN